jgi:hypothetical protein
MHLPKQPNGQAYIVFDEKFAKKFSGWPYFISTAPGIAYAYLKDYRSARPDLFHVASTSKPWRENLVSIPSDLSPR